MHAINRSILFKFFKNENQINIKRRFKKNKINFILTNSFFFIFKELLVNKFKNLLRQLEELHIEALILNDLNNEELEDDDKKIENINVNISKNLIEKWNYMAHVSEFDDLKNLITESEIMINEENTEKNLNAVPISSSSTVDFEQKQQCNQSDVIKINEEEREINNTATIINNTKNKISSILSSNKDTIEINPNKNEIDLMSSSIIELKNTVDTEKSVQSDINNSCNPSIFISCLEKLHKSLQVVDKHLDNIQKPNKEFHDFEKQNLKFNSIKDALESLSAALKTSIKHKKVICEKANKDLNKKITKTLNQLTKEHQLVVKKYKEKDSEYIKNVDLWKEFHKDYEKMDAWLNTTINKLHSLKNIYDNDRIEEIVKDFSNLTSYRLLLERTNLNGHEIIRKSHENESKLLNENLINLNKTWKSLIACLNELKERQINKSIEMQLQKNEIVSKPEAKTIFEEIKIKLNEINVWISNGQSLSKKVASPVDELENERLILEINVSFLNIFKIVLT